MAKLVYFIIAEALGIVRTSVVRNPDCFRRLIPISLRIRCRPGHVGAVADTLRPGDRVWFRHAKAGELCEHVNELQLIDGETATPAPTYRGEGHAFLG